ncbi:hypothetical protein [Mesorhizobium sp. ISC11]
MTGLAPRRLKTGQALLENVDTAGSRIRDGIDLLKRDTMAREAFGLMNTAMAMANRRREAEEAAGRCRPANMAAVPASLRPPQSRWRDRPKQW